MYILEINLCFMTFEFQDHWKLITLESDKPLEITVWIIRDHMRLLLKNTKFPPKRPIRVQSQIV